MVSLRHNGCRYRERHIGGKTYRSYADEGRNPRQRLDRLPGDERQYAIIRAASAPDSTVLDPMCGSGTTLAVADRSGRRWVGIDQGELAIDIACKRLGL